MLVPRVELRRSEIEFPMFVKIRCSENMFLLLHKVFSSILSMNNHWARIDNQLSRIKRSLEGSLDEERSFEDQLWYLELNFGGRKSSFQCLVKSDVPKTCSYDFVGCFAFLIDE